MSRKENFADLSPSEKGADNNASIQEATESTSVLSESSHTSNCGAVPHEDHSSEEQNTSNILINNEENSTSNYGWVTDSQNTKEDAVKNENIDSIDNGLPSYISATTLQPSAPPLSPPFDSNEHHPSQNNVEITNSNLESLNLNTDGETNNVKVVKIFRSEVKKISLKVNLIRAAKKLLRLLNEVHKRRNLYEGAKVKAAIFRYEHFWLPLVAKIAPGIKVSPPLDVHWVWIVHMLSPQNYEKDCIAIVGKIIPHQLMTEKALAKSYELGKSTWEQLYTDEPWEIAEQSSLENRYQNNDSKISYHLEDAIGRQSAFFYQVSMGHYTSKAFLCKAAYRYKQFLALKRAYPEQFLVPCYDMDIIWHAHQVHPVIYREDTTQILGHLFPHDDSVNDRSEGSKLCLSDANTRELWLKVFGTTFRREGAMFRGDPPSTYLNDVPKSALQLAKMSVFHVTVTKVKIKGHFSDGPLRIKLKQEGQKLCDFKLFHHGSGMTDHNVTEMNLNFVVSERLIQNWLVLKFSSGNKLQKILKYFGKGNFWSMTNFEELFDIEDEGIIDKVFTDDESSSTVELQMNVKRIRISDWTPIGIMTGEFLPCVLEPQTLVSHYGMITSTKSNNQDIYLAEMATHRLLNESSPKKPQVMEIEVYHSKHFMFSAIHLFVDSPNSGRSLVGIAHTLDLNTIPSPGALKYNIGSHLESRIAALNVSAGERAMLIKTEKKDWALLIGRWQGLRRGVKGSFSARGVPGSPGYLVVKMYCPIDAPPICITLPYEKQIYAFQLPDLFIDLENGRLQINRDSEDFVEQIALGLTITVLHVLCQPRPLTQDTVDGTETSTPPLLPMATEDAPKRIPTERLKFLAALGFFCASAPTNAFLTKKVERVRSDSNERGIGYPGIGVAGFWPAYICTDTDNGVDACGGCGGCGGGVFETIPAPSSVLWGSNQRADGDGGDGGGNAYDGYEGGGGSDWGWSHSDGGNGPSSNLLDVFFSSSGGGDSGGGGDGGDGGGCGGCGGCGG